MINLLPTSYRESLHFARRNTSLRGWVIALSAVLLGAIVVTGGGYWYLRIETNKQAAALERSKQELQAQNIDQVRGQVDEMSGNIRLAIQVLQREVLFSKLLRQLGSAMPANTALTQLAVEDEIKGGLSLEAVASNLNSASQIQVNLESPENQIFAKSDIESITCNESDIPGFPCAVRLKALFNNENPFVYIQPSELEAGGGQ